MTRHILHTTLAAAALTCAMAAPASAASTYAATRYPIVLAHGLLGWDKALGSVDHFYGVPADLRANGATVYATQVSGVNSSYVRGEQLLEQVKTVLAVTGAEKVNLIGQSQGNQSVRYVAAMLPGKVASVTSVSGVTFGSPAADVVQGLTTVVGPLGTTVIAKIFEALGTLIGLASGKPDLAQDGIGALESLTTSGAAAFNSQFPAGVPTTDCGQGAAVVDGVRYYSWSGVGQVTNPLDITDGLLAITTLAFRGEDNDGLVGRCASHLGVVLRDNYPANHIDTLNQMLGLTGWGFNALATYRQHANRLKLQGL